MRAGRVLRQIVIARIADQVPSLTAVVDNATEGTVYPFASMGPSNWIPADAECIVAREDWRPTDDRLYLEMLSEARA